MKKAYVVGVDKYANHPLTSSVNDAHIVAELLCHNADGSPNFDVVKGIDVQTKHELVSGIKSLFTDNDDVDTALFYFSGHGMFDGDKGYLVLPDVYATEDGLPLQDVLNWANRSSVKNKIIVLDCCHAGAISVSLNSVLQPYIARGVTVLAASRESEGAIEGVFTPLLCEALRGGAAGICGTVTPGNVYAFIDRSLGPWLPRPVFVTHVTSFISLRSCVPKVPIEIIRDLPQLFPDDAFEYKLDPSYEDTNDPSVTHIVIAPYAKKDHVEIFKRLQRLQSVGIVEPVGAPYMYFAAMKNKACRLTALGVHYMHLARDGRL